jgi:hypothetical protein
MFDAGSFQKKRTSLALLTISDAIWVSNVHDLNLLLLTPTQLQVTINYTNKNHRGIYTPVVSVNMLTYTYTTAYMLRYLFAHML